MTLAISPPSGIGFAISKDVDSLSISSITIELADVPVTALKRAYPEAIGL
jgi:hypothetical protein